MTIFWIIITSLAIIALYMFIRLKAKKRSKHQDLIERIHERIATANGASIEQFSLDNISTSNTQKRDIIKGVKFINKDCTSLDDFVINNEINSFDLIKLADLNTIQLQISKAWYPLVIELIKELNENGWDKRVTCIKEKFAALKFYVSTEKYDDIIDRYEEKSKLICETCGEKGKIRFNSSWDYVACRRHYLENRGKLVTCGDGFSNGKSFYKWKEVKCIHINTSDINEVCNTVIVELYKNKVVHPGWKDNKLYISKYNIGFGSFLTHLPDKFKTNPFDKEYIEKFQKVDFCEICGYEAVYFGHCECCENDTWEKYVAKFKRTRDTENNYNKREQIWWTNDEGEVYESQQNNYLKSPNYKILFSEEEYKSSIFFE